MTSKITGTVRYANGKAASGVQVRVFDRDAPGKGDDDLTVQPGLSNERGRFSVLYDPGKYMDFASLPFFGLRGAGGESGIRVPDLTDILSPYLQFCYLVSGENRLHTAPLELFEDEFLLPDPEPLRFQPSKHGFRFVNSFPGFELPFSLPGMKAGKKLTGVYGLCGGMSAAACDIYLSNRMIPPASQPPRVGSRFHRYLFQRAMDSFDMGESILRFARWMTYPDDTPHGTWRLTLDELEKVKVRLDAHLLTPLGLVFSKGRNLQEISQKVWLNHQVLAYCYQEKPDGSVDVHIYDPNCDTDGTRQDEVRLHCQRVLVSEPGAPEIYGLRCVETNLWVNSQKRSLEVRGFFPMPYRAIEPPEIKA